jgi:hypothetical protein
VRFTADEALAYGWITEAEAKEIKAGEKKFYPRAHKYNAQTVEIDGHKFQSRKEANYYCELKLRLRAGEITKIELQPRYTLEEGRRLKNGKWLRKREYVADFRITMPDGSQQVVDTKGYRTREYKRKIQEFMDKYPEIDFREV